MDHINGIRDCNRFTNLRWLTRKQNNGRKQSRNRIRANHKYTSHRGQVILARRGGEVKKYRNGIDAAKGIGCSHVLVYRVLNPLDYPKSVYGWKLEYVEG